MNNGSHLYSVDGEGTVEETDSPSTRRASTKARPKYPLPTDRMKFETAVNALRAYCTLSRGGTEAVGTEDLARNLGVSPATAGLNNMFFVSVGLITRATKGLYTPSDLAMKFHQKYGFDKGSAPLLLAPQFADTWFFDAVMQKLEIKPDATRKEVMETLASVAGVFDDSDRAKLAQLLEWLNYVGLIVFDGDRVLIADEAPSDAPDDQDDTATDSVTVDATPASGQGKRATTNHPAASPPLVSLSLEIVLTTDELSILDPEQIRALFDGIGAIASVKARLDERLAEKN